MRLATSDRDAWEMVDELSVCDNCENLLRTDLFGGYCRLLKREVDSDQVCEGFYARDKKVGYWIHKLVEMALEFSEENDFHRQFDYHERAGTLDEFLLKD